MSFGGFIRRNTYWTVDFFKGSPVGKHFKDIKFILKGGKDAEKRRIEHLDNILKHATWHSEFYKEYKGKGINDFPVVNKLILSENFNLVAVAREYIPEQSKGEIHMHKTSGSTGVPFAVYQDTRKRNRRVAALKYFGETAGYKSHERLAQCRIWNVLRGKSKLQSFKENILPVNISIISDELLSEICDILHSKNVKALLCYGSWLESFSEYLKLHPQKFKHLKVIISSADMLKPSTREHLISALGCDVVERYANEEQGVLGQQSFNSSCYYLNHANYYFEILKMDSDEAAEFGEVGRIVITDLFNYAFPLIRYDTGDVGVMEKPDKYSMGYPILSKLYGRKVDMVYNTKKTAVNPYSFSTIFKSFSFIKQWQLIQKDEKSYLVKLTVKNIPDDAELNKLKSYIKDVMGQDADVQTEFTDEIPVLTSGKRKTVVCEWKRDK